MPRLIDADKVADAIAWLDEYDFVIWHDVQECIDKVPTVDAEPVRHGHWTNFTSSTEECSCCGHEFYISALFSVGYNNEPPFCPNCGAKMDEVKDE